MKRFLIGALVAGSLFASGAIAESVPNTLAKVKASKVINVAFAGNALPFSFVGTNNEPAGYSIDLCKRVIASIGKAVGQPNLKVNWLAGSTPERLQMIATGKADLECGNTSQTLARLANVDFSGLTFIDAGGIMIRADSPFHSMADLDGKKIAVLKGTTTEARLNAIVQKHMVNTRVVPVGDANEGVAMLESGSADAYAGDKIKLVGLAAQAKDPAKFVMLAEEISFEPYAMALPRGDSALRLEVNRALTQVYLSDDIETIFARWLGVLGRPTPLLSAMYLLYSIPE
ncbi:MAG: amino acid ABC transporter substrate-binding protein [Dechloromonas sp.]|nr:MAG: amino acid ABC transporter substrate-binding protein [Dechloromonas sp.]